MADDAKEPDVTDKKAEVRKKLQELGGGKKKKKGFMTKEQKKRIRAFIRKKAALLHEKEKSAMSGEKQEYINKLCGEQKSLENLSLEEIIDVIKQYHQRYFLNESQKWDLEFEVRRRDMQIEELNLKVNNLRGKFQKPKLKKVSQYENQLAKLKNNVVKQFNFKGQLKSVK